MPRSANLQNQSPDQMIEVPEELEVENAEIIWSGGASICSKKLKHYPTFTRSGTTIPVYSFVFILAGEDTHNVGYLEDLYEDQRSQKMVKVRWFHRTEEVSGLISHPRPNEIILTPHFQVVSAECVDGLATVLTPKHYEHCLAIVSEDFSDGIYMCSRQIKKNKITPFPLSRLRGYTNQTIFSILDPSIGPNKLKQQISSREEKEEAVACQVTKEIQSSRGVLTIKNSVSNNQAEKTQPTSSEGLDGASEPHHEVPSFSVGKITNLVSDNQVEKTQPTSSKGLDGASGPHHEVPSFSVGKVTVSVSDNHVEKNQITDPKSKIKLSSKELDGTSDPYHEILPFSVGINSVSDNQVEKTQPTEPQSNIKLSSKGLDGTSKTHHEVRLFSVGKITNSVSDNQVEKTKPTEPKSKIKLSSKGLDGTSEPHQDVLPSFSVGEEIEVLSNDSGIRGCWFRCKILEVSEKSLKVVYMDVEDADIAENLEECINAYRVAVPDKLRMRCLGRPTIRPFPAKTSSNGSFSIGAPVDAWWCDGWWEGVVVATNIRGKNPFRVYFPGENRFLNFENEKLRNSKDWFDNKWVEVNPKPDVLNIIPSNVKIQRCLTLGGSSGNGLSSVDHKSTETEAAGNKGKEIPVQKKLKGMVPNKKMNL